MDATIMTRPTITIYCSRDVTEEKIKELLYGIEEESIPWYIEAVNGEKALNLADKASQDSALGVGIGCTNNSIVLSYKNLPPDLFIFKLRDYQQHKESLRTLGTNAARLAKGNPFKIDQQLEVSF